MLKLKSVFGIVSQSKRSHVPTTLLKNIVRYNHQATIIDGKRIAEDIQNELSVVVKTWVAAGKKKPKFVAILVGNHPASQAYVGRKVKTAREIGIDAEKYHLNEDVLEEEVLNQIDMLNKDNTVDGIIVQLPVPAHIDEKKLCDAISPDKDVDGFHRTNIGSLTLDRESIIPATALGVKELIVRSKIETFGKNAVVIGRSKHVGLPIAILLSSDGKGETRALDMTTTICHRYTPPEELVRFTKSADLVVAAAGVPGLITKDMIKPGACVIDVGISRVQEGNKLVLRGDVDFNNVKEVAGHITPVPGGVGPMTVAMLMKNTIVATIKRDKGDLILQEVTAFMQQ